MRKEIEFGGVESQGIIFTPEGEGEFPAIVCYHGYGSQLVNYAPIAERLASVGIIGMVFSSKFYGENAVTGFNRSVDQWILEGQEALDFLTNYPHVEKRKIGVLGTSLGGFVAASLLSENQHIISCVLRAPASYDEQALRVGYSSRSLRAIQDFEGSLLVVESESDEVIPHSLISDYLNNAIRAREKSHYVIKNALHSLGGSTSPFREEFLRVAVNWFERTLR